MPRKNRQDYLYDGCVVHARLQINNGEFFFNKKRHFNHWYRIALRYLHKYNTVSVNGYQWMNNHCHMIITADKWQDLCKFLHDLNWRFSFEFNKLHKRKGHFFQSRFRCSVVESDEYEKIVHRYVYRNQVRAGMVSHVKRTRWSSYHYYAYGRKDPLITPFRNFFQFGLNKKLRALEFRNFIEMMTDNEEWEFKQRLAHWNLKSNKDVMWNYMAKSGAG